MARIRVPSGTIQKLEKVFDDLQSFLKDNQKKRLQLLFKDSFGLALGVKNGIVTDADFKITLNVTTDTPTSYTINAGQFITLGNDYVRLNAPYTAPALDTITADAFYLITIRYAEQGANLQTSMSSFLYDPLNGETSQYTRFNDSFVVQAVRIYPESG